MKTLAPLDGALAAERVLGWQTKLHRWAAQDELARFGDLFNLVCDPATLLVAWERVKRNRGSRTAGVDGQTRARVEQIGVDGVLARLREELKAGTYRPLPARERLIPKCSGSEVRQRIAAVWLCGELRGRACAGEEPVEVVPGELPFKGRGDLLVAAPERQQVRFESVEVGEVVGRQRLALDDAEVDLGLVEPAGVDRGVDEHERGPGALEAVDRALAAVR